MKTRLLFSVLVLLTCSVRGQINNIVAPGGTLTLKTNVTVTGALVVGATNIVGALSSKAELVSPAFTTPSLGAATALTLDTGQGANELYDMDQDVMTTSDPLFGVITAKKSFRVYQGSLTHAGTVTLDFDATTTVNALTITGNVTFATSNLATNRTYRLKITGTSTNATPTFPATWNFLGGAPTVITASKVGMLSLEAWGTTDESVVAAFSEAQ